MKLDAYEKELLEAYERAEMSSETPSKAFLAQLSKAAEMTFKKDKRINIRLSNHDLTGIRRKALKKAYLTRLSFRVLFISTLRVTCMKA
jgi:predicted DNA binding CopG/RHH family protein